MTRCNCSTNLVPSINTARGRREVLNGRHYLVVPMTMIKPGVLNGSQGKLFYPPNEVKKNPERWNNTPIVVYHPTVRGQAVSARSPEILDRQGIGHVFRSRISNSGKLQAEGWIDIEKARAVDPRVIERIESGQPIELSTGLFTDNFKAAPGSNHKGRSYDYVARNYRPDHLAILPDQVGACSLKDGCGVLVNGDSSQLVLINARRIHELHAFDHGGAVDPRLEEAPDEDVTEENQFDKRSQYDKDNERTAAMFGSNQQLDDLIMPTINWAEEANLPQERMKRQPVQNRAPAPARGNGLEVLTPPTINDQAFHDPKIAAAKRNRRTAAGN